MLHLLLHTRDYGNSQRYKVLTPCGRHVALYELPIYLESYDEQPRLLPTTGYNNIDNNLGFPINLHFRATKLGVVRNNYRIHSL